MNPFEIEFTEHKEQYEKWPFPNINFISNEGLLFLRYIKKWLEQKQKRNFARVIDIGCGTGHTVLNIASQFPDHQFLGIDRSGHSLNIAEKHAKKLNLKNIQFQACDINSNLSHLGLFDMILCLGVLHHLKDMKRAFKRIIQLLNKDGYIILWFYGVYGRYKHNLNQIFIKTLSKNKAKSEMVSLAGEFVRHMGDQYVLHSGFYSPHGSDKNGLDWLQKHPQWLVDQMVPAYECPVTLGFILDIFKKYNIEFENWFGVSLDIEHYTSSKLLIDAFQSLSDRDKMISLDYLLKPEYYFIAGKKNG